MRGGGDGDGSERATQSPCVGTVRILPGWTRTSTHVLRVQVSRNRISVLCQHWCPGCELYYDSAKWYRVNWVKGSGSLLFL